MQLWTIGTSLRGAGSLAVLEIDRRDDRTDRLRTVLTIASGEQRLVEAGLRRRAAPLRYALDRLTPAQKEGLIRGLELLARKSTPPRALR
jgi:hypothetical protein